VSASEWLLQVGDYDVCGDDTRLAREDFLRQYAVNFVVTISTAILNHDQIVVGVRRRAYG
jgi:hypothetical protein